MTADMTSQEPAKTTLPHTFPDIDRMPQGTKDLQVILYCRLQIQIFTQATSPRTLC